MNRLLLTLLALATPAFCQEAVYSAFYEATAAVNVVTIQQPSSSPTKSANFSGEGLGFAIYCSAACTVTFEHTGTAATATALTPKGTSPGLGASALLAFRSSDVGVGTVIDTYRIAAGDTRAFSIRALLTRTASLNLTARVSSVATSSITGIWKEE